ncbi:MAG: hypothetical protein GY772_00685 [bacterium]|nr:hypothetical protein [bacterium]
MLDGEVLFVYQVPKEAAAPPTTTLLGTALFGTARLRTRCSMVVVGSKLSFRVKCFGMLRLLFGPRLGAF